MATERNPVFSELHGYFVKDAYAREVLGEQANDIADISTKQEANKKDAGLIDTGKMFLMTTTPKTIIDDVTYYQNGCCVTNDNIVFARSTADNRGLCLYVINKNTYAPAVITGKTNPVIIDLSNMPFSTAHSNSAAFVEDQNEIHIKANYSYEIIIDAESFDVKRTEELPYTGYCAAYGYDPINNQWAYICYNDAMPGADKFIVRIHDENDTLINEFELDRVSTCQDATFYDGLIILALTEQGEANSYQDRYNANFEGAQNIIIFDTEGNILRSWWYSDDYVEFEGVSIITDGRAIVATKHTDENNNLCIYALPYKHINDTMNLREYDTSLILPLPDNSADELSQKNAEDIDDLFAFKSGWMQGNINFTNLDARPTKDNFGVWWLNCSAADITGAKPETSGQGVLICVRQSSAAARQMWIRVNGTVYNRTFTYATETWSAWTSSAENT